MVRLAGISAGGAILVAGVLAIAAYAVAGEPLPHSGRAATSGQAGNLAALAHGNMLPSAESQSPPPSGSGPAAPSGPAASAGSADTSGSAASAVSGYFIAGKAVPLTAAELEELRGSGWACPELSRLGFHLVAATASIRGGDAAVELQLSNGTSHATVVEEHTTPGAVQIGGDKLQVTPGSPWRAVYRTPSAVFTYDSDLPPGEADGAVPELMQAGAAVRPTSNTNTTSVPETLPERLQRGLRTLAGLAGF